VIIDAKSRKVLGNIATKAPNTHWFALAPDGSRAYLAHKEYPAVTVLDLHRREVITEIPTRGGCEEIATSPDGRWAFAATPKMSLTVNLALGQITPVTRQLGDPTPALIKIDTKSNTIVGRLEFKDLIAAVWVSSEGKVFVTEFVFPDPESASDDPTPGRINIVDGESLTLLHSIECDELPFTTRTSPDGSRAFVANLKTGTVSVIDVAAGKRIATLESNVGKKMGATHPLAYAPGQPADASRERAPL
jgi:YVTN family beta-propeller protein